MVTLAPTTGDHESVDFAVLGYAITSVETETDPPSRISLLGDRATPEQRRETSLETSSWSILRASAPPAARLSTRWSRPRARCGLLSTPWSCARSTSSGSRSAGSSGSTLSAAPVGRSAGSSSSGPGPRPHRARHGCQDDIEEGSRHDEGSGEDVL